METMRTTTPGPAAPTSSLDLDDQLRAYEDIFTRTRTDTAPHDQTPQMVNHYYDLVTEFYEFGWGDCFHFAPIYRGDTFRSSLERHQHYLAAALDVGAGEKVLDAGCGIAGPLRSIHRFTHATVVGLNNNDHQVSRAHELNQRAGVSSACPVVKGSFMDMPFEAESMDAAYAIEATCHAPSLRECYAEFFRVLRPGAIFAAYEWCITDLFDDRDASHRETKRGIERGNGLPPLRTTRDVLDGLESAGFDVLRHQDRAAPTIGDQKWFTPLSAPDRSWRGIARGPAGRWMTRQTLGLLERLGLASQGTAAVSELLNEGANHLVRGGELGIFTPMFFFAARKP